jgi:hypothetical protein
MTTTGRAKSTMSGDSSSVKADRVTRSVPRSTTNVIHGPVLAANAATMAWISAAVLRRPDTGDR